MSLTVTHATTSGSAKVDISTNGVVSSIDASKTLEAATNPVLQKQGIIQRTAAEFFMTDGIITQSQGLTLKRPLATR